MRVEPTHCVAAVTICSSNYFAKALVLQESYLRFNPESDFYIIVVDRKHGRFDKLGCHSRILWVEDLPIERFYQLAFKFDVVELNTNVKPTVLQCLLRHYSRVVYLDPDVRVYAPLSSVFESLQESPIVVTPHTLTPIHDGRSPSDVEFLRFGSFNLGFLGVSSAPEGALFLDWWSRRCLEFGYYEPQLGLAVDQKWVDLAPSFFPGLKVLRDLGLNVAFWNLHERTLSKRGGNWMVNGSTPLRFFHFSSFVLSQPHAIAHKQSRFVAEGRPDLHELLDEYSGEVKNFSRQVQCPAAYSFDYFEDGLYVSPTLRRLYAAMVSCFEDVENPFGRNSAVQRFALSKGLAGKSIRGAPRVSTFKEIQEHSRAAGISLIMLRLALRILGPNRYFLLMRYMAHMSSIRNQAGLFGDAVRPDASRAEAGL